MCWTHQSEITVSPTTLASYFILSMMSWQFFTPKFFVFNRSYPSSRNTSLIFDSSGSVNTLNRSFRLQAPWVMYPSFVASKMQIYPSSIQIQRFTQPTILSHNDFHPPLLSSSRALTQNVTRLSWTIDAHLYFCLRGQRLFPLIVKVFISSPAILLDLPLTYLQPLSTCSPSSSFFFSGEKFRSEGSEGSKISVPICGWLSSPSLYSNIYYPSSCLLDMPVI